MTDFFTYFYSLLATYTVISPVKYSVEIYVNNCLYCLIKRDHSVEYMVPDETECFDIDLENAHIVADDIQMYNDFEIMVVDIYVEED